MCDYSTFPPSPQMTGQGYKRTNFEDDDNISNGPGTPPGIEFNIPRSAYNTRQSPWKKKTQLERTLIVLVGILTLLLVILISVLASRNAEPMPTLPPSTTVKPAVYIPPTKAPQTSPICLTSSCVEIAGSLLSSMNLAADPCDDFYDYACGGWVKKHPIPSGHAAWGIFSELARKNQVVLRTVIEEPISKSTSVAQQKAKIYYLSCMDKNKTIEQLGAKPLLDLVETIGVFSFIHNRHRKFNTSLWHFQSMLEKVHSNGQSALFSMGVGVDDKDSSSNVIQLDQGGLTLPRDYYINKNDSNKVVLDAYLELMTKIGVLLGGERNETEGAMRNIIDFETRLAKINIPPEERRDEEKNYNKRSVGQLNQLAYNNKEVSFLANNVKRKSIVRVIWILTTSTPVDYRIFEIDWLSYFKKMFEPVNIVIDSDEDVVIQAPTFFGNLTNLITDMTKDDPGRGTLNDYLLWRIVSADYQFLSKPFRDAGKILSEAISGSSGNEEKWRICVDNTDSVLGFAMGAMFVKESFRGASQEKVLNMAEDMVSHVKDAFISNLPSVKWMDKATCAKAVDKAKGIVDMIGYPKYILDDKKLDKEYEDLIVNENAYFRNNMRNVLYTLNKNLKKLRKKPEKNNWDMSPQTINAYYAPSDNKIVFPAGILQAPFYDQSFPASLNYGGMGVVVGHEITHGFDDQGRKYDKAGNLKSWWKTESIEKFTKRATCMEKQYSKYTMNGEHIHGKVTLGENIADNGGLKSSYQAFLKLQSENPAELPLPGLNITHKQLFFLGFARVWCSKATKESIHLQLTQDPHTPAKFRVIGTLSNSRDFAAEFKCPAGSRMNPTEKCEVW